MRSRDLENYARAHATKIRFVLAGGLNTAFGLAIYPTLFFVLAPLKLHYLGVLVIAQALSITFAFVTNKFLVFKTKGNAVSEYGKFLTFHLGHLAVNLAVLPILVEFGHMSPAWAQVFYALVVIVSSYFWHSRITFRSIGA